MSGKITLLLDYLEPSQLELMPACSTETALMKLIDDSGGIEVVHLSWPSLISQQPLISSLMVTFWSCSWD